MAVEKGRRILGGMGKLERLIAELKKLPDEEQESWANFILAEMELSRMPGHAGPVDELDRLAEEALAEDRAGLTVPFDEAELNRMTAEALAKHRDKR